MTNPHSSFYRRWLVPVAVYFALLLVVSWSMDEPIKSIFPYLLPVILVSAWRGIWPGLMISVISTLVAWAGGAFPTVPENAGLEFDEALITLAELAVAAVVVYKVREKLTRPASADQP